jgi:type II secretory pathway pseudopilin PulG
MTMRREGLTLIETVVGIALVSAVVVAFGVSLTAAVFAQRIKLRNMAAALGEEQLAAIRYGDTSTLTATTNGPLVNILFPRGTFSVVTDNTAPSQTRALNAATSTSSGMAAVLPLPANAYGDFTLTAKFKVNAGSPSSWKAGVLFRASDDNDLYEVYLTSTALVFKKIEHGASTTLYSDVRSIATNSWQTLGVTATGASLSVTLNGNAVTTQNDPTFSVGEAALAVWDGASVNFDDVSIGGATWNFEDTSVGEMQSDWLRFGLGDLNSGTGTLTIATPYGDTSYKTYTVNISWKDRSGSVKTISQSTQKQD